MKVLTLLTILCSYYVCICINSDDEDEAKAETERIILGMSDEQLDEHMKNLRLGARPKNRTPLTNQFDIDLTSSKEKAIKEMERLTEKEEEDFKQKERDLREKEKMLFQEEKKLEEEARKLEEEEEKLCEKYKLRKLMSVEQSEEQKPNSYGYQPYDPSIKHFAPGPVYRPVDPKMLAKPPAAVSYKSFINIPESDSLQDLFPEIPPPPTSFPRPCQCGCGPKSRQHHNNDQDESQQDQGASGGAPQQPVQPQSTQSSQNIRRDDPNFERHKEFPPYGQGNVPHLPFGGVQVIPPPPPQPPFQNYRPPPSSDEPKVKKPAIYEDITPEKISISVEIKKGRCALKSNFFQRYGRNGKLCHILTPVKNHDYKEVKYKDQTIWKTTNDRKCVRVELCNIGQPEKLVFLDFNKGSSEKYKKTNGKWYKI